MKKAVVFKKTTWILPVVFFAAFLLYTPLDAFNSWIPTSFHRGYYSILRMDPGDDTAFYAFLRSTYFDGDLDFSNEEWLEPSPIGPPMLRGFFQAHHLTRTGYASALTHGIGAAILWTPFLIVGHLVSAASERLGWELNGNALPGFRHPEMLALGLGSALYVFFGLAIMHRLLRRRFSAWISGWAVAAILLTSELPYYAFIRSRMAHAGEFFVFAVALWFWEKIYRREDGPWDRVLLACSFGFLALTRLNDVLYLGLPLGLLCYRALDGKLKNPAGWKSAFRWSAMTVGIVALSLVPMFVALKILFGAAWPVDASGLYRQLSQEHPIFAAAPDTGATYSIYDFGFILAHTQVLKALFTPLFGLVWSTPFLLLGWAGLVFLVKSERPRGVLFLLGYLPIFALYHGRLGDDYGHRYLLPTWYFLAFSAAALLEAAGKKWGEKRLQISAAVCLGVLAAWSYVLLLQYKTVLAYNDPLYCLKALQNLGLIGSDIPLWRSTSLPGILFVLGRLQISSGLDALMVIFLPLTALGLFLGAGWWIVHLRRRIWDGRILAAGYLALILGCSGIFWVQNRPLPPERIVARLQEHAQVLVARWPSRPAHHHTGLYLLKLALEVQPSPELRDRALQTARFLTEQYTQRHVVNEAKFFARETTALSAP